jgi:hypothetical protein
MPVLYRMSARSGSGATGAIPWTSSMGDGISTARSIERAHGTGAELSHRAVQVFPSLYRKGQPEHPGLEPSFGDIAVGVLTGPPHVKATLLASRDDQAEIEREPFRAFKIRDGKTHVMERFQIRHGFRVHREMRIAAILPPGPRS